MPDVKTGEKLNIIKQSVDRLTPPSLKTERVIQKLPDEHQDRIRLPFLREHVTNAATAAQWIHGGMIIGMSGFTRAGDASRSASSIPSSKPDTGFGAFVRVQ
ncbi:hypothetical protein [Polaromonas sp. UBA4122]|uniref:hypothetical protein n=1 Tax=Polaromonas sp. UBA4122 TaxID=1947074 RepID=UPI0025D8BA29|nr:hypothetical protein [Polaromonas sp. UBA4122]